MNLLDPKLPWLLTLAFLISFTATIIFWSNFSKNSMKAILSRILFLIVTILFALMSSGIFLNNYGNFYTSWGELFGKNIINPTIISNSNNLINKSDLINASFTAGGSAILRKTIQGETSGITAQVIIAIPPSFVSALQKGVEPKHNYRFLEYLSGYPGHPMAWIHGMKIVEKQEEKYASNSLPEVITVLPELNIYPKVDAECMNLPNGPQIESWITKDVVSYSEKWLGQNDSKWGVAGFSSGGWCSAMLVLKHPDQFDMGVSIAGYFVPEVAVQVQGSNKSKLKSEYDLYKILANNPPPVSLYVVDSINDKSSHNSTIRFLGKIQNPISLTEVVIKGAGHNFDSWKQIIPSMLDWFGTKLQVSGKL